MVDVAAPPTSRNGTGGAVAPRLVRRPRSLPGGRAVVGGFLVAASAVGLFAAYSASTAGPRSSYVVATRDVPAGARLERADLDLVALDLPGDQAATSFTDLDVVTGATTLGALGDGQLVAASDVAKPAGGPGTAQISLPVDPGSAVGGNLRPGDTVDVIVTYSRGGEPVTTTVSAAAEVVEVLAGDATVGGSGELVIVLAVPPEELEPLAQASAAGTVVLARTTGLERE